uniref:Uncharacterized protein n=1 Tax=Trichuris muris TaxID=70415 RepID=A0A5S6QUI9_TRIMR
MEVVWKVQGRWKDAQRSEARDPPAKQVRITIGDTVVKVDIATIRCYVHRREVDAYRDDCLFLCPCCCKCFESYYQAGRTNNRNYRDNDRTSKTMRTLDKQNEAKQRIDHSPFLQFK